jgi:ribosomal protein S18 acetylase RimI-like enzyme
LQKIYFRKSATGKGYGAAMLEHVFDMVRHRSNRRIWLDVLKINVGAQRFYEKSGFARLGEMPFKTDRAEVGMVVMARELA